MNTIGTVYLVGAGPGDPDLLTLRAARLLARAELVVHDGLVDPAVLTLAAPKAKFVSVAKSRARHTAGVPVEVVPGVTSALGAAAAAQIALTHREAASVVSFVAGQCKSLGEQNWAGLAGKGRTLVIYMGVKTAAGIAEKLMADGLAPEMPIAVIENACRPEMRVLRAPLAGLPDLVERERVKNPALILIGEVTARADVALGQLASEFAQ